MAAPRLDLLADSRTFWFTPPPGEPLSQALSVKQADAVERLLQQRFPLSSRLQQRIRQLEQEQSAGCRLIQVVFGICLPSGLLIGTRAWDYDRDMDVLRKEAAVVLAQHFPPGGWELQERIDSEAPFQEGKRLFALYLS